MQTTIKHSLILLSAGIAASIAIYAVATFLITQDSHIIMAAAVLYFITGLIMSKASEAGWMTKTFCLNLPIVLIVLVLTGGELAFTAVFSLTTVLFTCAGLLFRAHKMTGTVLAGGIVSASLYMAVVGYYVFPLIMANDKLTVTNAPAPEFELTGADGGKIKSSDLAGKIVLINFWATWCSKCLQELPQFDKVYQTYKDNDNVTVLAVDLGSDGESLEKAKKFIAKKGYEWNTAFDADTSAFSKMKLEDIPATVILDRSGNIRLIHTGYNATEDFALKMQSEIEKLLTE